MLKGWGTWLGLESAQDPKTIGYQCENMTELQQTNASKCEVNKPSTDRNGDDPLNHPLQAQGLRGYLMNFASSASKRISESISETAQSIKRTVEEGKIDIIDQTILGDFQKEQAKFVQEKKSKKIDAAVPPWVGYNEEETIQKQILALSADRRNFLREPPVGVQFDFDFDQMYPTALAMLEEDKLLNKMRFDLVPKHVKEDVFWRNYLYRVSLIKQSAQLTALAAQRRSAERREDRSLSSNTGPVEPKSPPSVVDASAKHNEQEDVRRGMERLVLDEELLKNEELADWERELQQELQEYEVAVEEGSRDEQWDREMEELLQQD